METNTYVSTNVSFYKEMEVREWSAVGKVPLIMERKHFAVFFHFRFYIL